MAGQGGAIAGGCAALPDENCLALTPTARSTPVAGLTGHEIAPPGTTGRYKAVTRWAMLNLRRQTVWSHTLGADVQIGRKGIEKALSHAGDTLLSAFPAIPALVAHGTYVGQPAKPHDAKDESTRAWHLLGGIVHINGQNVAFVVHIREAQNGWFFYDLCRDRDDGTG